MSGTDALPFAEHDHGGCVEAVLARAERRCAALGARLTARRRRVLEILAGAHAGLGAYELIDRLADEGARPAPISVYRILDFLMAHGLVHRLASQNAYIACTRAGEGHRAHFLICNACRRVAELDSPALERALHEDARQLDFAVEECIVEIAGRCARCRAGEGDAGGH